ncbi:hypothetical protein [Streptomyces sp. Act143]|nr:hypothetical protein [Streptomyces sp. Act143]
MSFHKVTPVKKARKSAPAPAPAAKKKAQVKKATPQRRPISHKN